ncbi:MAG: hypothetical protein QMD14_05635 [Candidatus Aenigmarchaeota archaeon]|nr:hypothetical protein [Candidatus Aenigmarchaeota archaeon]
MVTKINLKNPRRARILIRQSALYLSPEELETAVAHETSHIVANYLGYRHALVYAYQEYADFIKNL